MKRYAILFLFAIASFTVSCKSKTESTEPAKPAATENAEAGAKTKPAGDKAAEAKAKSDDKSAKADDGSAHPRVKLVTSKGDIVIELAPEKAPITVENFLKYVKAKHYDGTVFHRVIGNFMIQGGGFELKDGKLVEKPTNPPIKNEADNGLQNLRGTIAMARTNNPDSATAQFFINVKDNPALDRRPGSAGYAVFGKVVEGMDVVDAIKAVPTTLKELAMRHPVTGQSIPSQARDVPADPVVITSAVVLGDK